MLELMLEPNDGNLELLMSVKAPPKSITEFMQRRVDQRRELDMSQLFPQEAPSSPDFEEQGGLDIPP